MCIKELFIINFHHHLSSMNIWFQYKPLAAYIAGVQLVKKSPWIWRRDGRDTIEGAIGRAKGREIFYNYILISKIK